MKRFKIVAAFAAAVMLFTTGLTPVTTVQADSVKITTSSYIGGYAGYSGVTDLTINGKKPTNSSLKKSLRAAKTATRKKGVTKVTKAYTSGKAKRDYVKTYDWEIDFLKAGTYTFKYKKVHPKYTYETDLYDGYSLYTYTITYYDTNDNPLGSSVYTTKSLPTNVNVEDYLDSTYLNNANYDYYRIYQSNDFVYRYQIITTNTVADTESVSKKLFVYKEDNVGNGYYISEDGKTIYAESPDLNVYVPAKLVSGVLSYQPLTYVTVTTTQKIKVQNTETPIIQSVKLGTASISYSSSGGDGIYSYTSTIKRFLSGTKGKVNVSMGSNSKLMDIVIETYDKDGNPVYKLVQNKKNVTYGKYAYNYESSYSDTYSSYDNKSTGLFKETRVYVFYKDKISGGYTDIQSVKYNSKTKSYDIKYKYKSPTASKAITTTSTSLPYSYMEQYIFYK